MLPNLWTRFRQSTSDADGRARGSRVWRTRALALGGVALLVVALAGGGFALTRQAHAASATVTDCTSTGSGSGTTGDLAYAIANVPSGGTINFACATGGPSIPVSGTLNINQSMTIDGSGGITLDASASQAQVFNVNFSSSGKRFILENITVTGGHADQGGALTITDGDIQITNSTFVGNTASAGGAVYNLGGTLSITNSTFVGNSATVGTGGAVLNEVFGTVSITNSTIVGNSAGAGDGAVGNGGTLSIGGSILAGNVGGSCYNLSAFGGTITSLGYNIEDANTCPFSATTHDLINTNPLLAMTGSNPDLASNGGPTQTIAPLDGSPAIERIPNDGSVTFNVNGVNQDACPTTDQRDYSRASDAKCSVGAYEYFPATKVTLNSPPSSYTYGTPPTLSATLAVADASLTTGQTGPTCGTITFTATPSSAGGAPITLGSGAISSGSQTVDVTPSTSALVSGKYTLTASYSGEGGCAPSSGATTGSYLASTSSGSALSVSGIATATTLTATTATTSGGQTVTLTATVDPAVNPTSGSVTFYNGSSVLVSASLLGSNSTSLTTPPLAAGTYHFSATYIGTTTFAASATSNTVTLTIASTSKGTGSSGKCSTGSSSGSSTGRSGNGGTTSPKTAQSPSTGSQSSSTANGHATTTSNGTHPTANGAVPGAGMSGGFPLWLAGLLALLAFVLLGGGALVVTRVRRR